MKKFLQNLALLLATGLGLGLSPVAPGTFGSLWGPALYLAGHPASPTLWFGAGALLILTAIVTSECAERVWGKKDDQRIVIDEVAGMWVTYSAAYLVAPYPAWLIFNTILGFVLFRFFDIVKWYPARLAQNKIAGGLGVVADDLVAGVQAGLVLWVIATLMLS